MNQIRESFSNLLGAYFNLHLEEELQKSNELLNFITIEGISFKEYTIQMKKNLLDNFPEIKNIKPKYNLFSKWHEHRNDIGVKSYRETTFKMINQFYFSRIVDFKNGDSFSRNLVEEKINILIGKGKSYGKDFTFGFLLRRENIFKECLRELILNHNEIEFEPTWKLILEQNEFYTECAYRHFDTILKESLKKSDDLLLNILPVKIAEELKSTNKVIPKFYENATVLFTDFKGFTKIAETLKPFQLIEELDNCFKKFDEIMKKNNLEKIKTIGDAYMCVGGIPIENKTHAIDACNAALQIIEVMKNCALEKKIKGKVYWDIRIGIHSGPIIAGVIGKEKFAYDIWGDTVNTASRLESSGVENKINISNSTYELVKDFFECEYRGKVQAKNKGEIDMYFLNKEN